MQNFCSDTFSSCCNRNDNIKAKLKTTEKWVAITSPDDVFKHGIHTDLKQMERDKLLSIYNIPAEKILTSMQWWS